MMSPPGGCMENCGWPSSAASQSCHRVTWWNWRPSSAGYISLLSHRSKQVMPMPSDKSAHMFLSTVWSIIHRFLMESGAVNLTGYSACLSVSTLYSKVWTIVLLWFTRTHSHKNAYMNHIQSVCVCVCVCVWLMSLNVNVIWPQGL